MFYYFEVLSFFLAHSCSSVINTYWRQIRDLWTYCCGFNGTYATGTYARNQYTGKIKM